MKRQIMIVTSSATNWVKSIYVPVIVIWPEKFGGGKTNKTWNTEQFADTAAAFVAGEIFHEFIKISSWIHTNIITSSSLQLKEYVIDNKFTIYSWLV